MTRLNANGLGLLLLFAVGAGRAYAATHPPLVSVEGAVASDQEEASKVGAAVLAKGGNAVDAAAATALALGVVNPSSSGIGGGGFAVIYIAKNKALYAVDFREVAPAALSPASFVVDGKLEASLSREGGLAVGVPGEVAGLEYIWKKFGSLHWPDVVEPSRLLAERGFEVSWFFAHAATSVVERVGVEIGIGRWLSPDGQLVRAGRHVRRSALARTLERIATKGSAGFYQGEVAEDIESAVRRAGGVLTARDLQSYQVVEREPLVGRFRGLRIATMPLPSSGGLLLLEMLGVLEVGGFDLAGYGPGSSAAYHLVAEVLKHGFADRARMLGDDPSSARIASGLLDPERLRDLAARIKPDGIAEHDSYGSKDLGRPAATGEDNGTSHVCVIDREGNAVALTTTVNGYFGSKLVAPRSGVVLNNEVDDFSLASGTSNMFGLVQSDYNLVRPGRRPLSSMTPTLVLDDQGVVGCFGGSGGPKIISNTFQAILNVFVHQLDVRQAVEAPRVHHQWVPDRLSIEKDIAADVVKGLQGRGHAVEVFESPTAVQAIIRRDDHLEAASDPRKAGAPAAPR